MPAVRAWTPVVALTPTPLVVAEASVVGPAWVMATVNWSAATTRLATDLIRVTCGLAMLVIVQVMTSPGPGVIRCTQP